MQRSKNFRCIALQFLLLTISGCAGFTTLPDGRSSTMSPANVRTRVNLAFRPDAAPISLRYHLAGPCQYRVVHPAVSKLPDEVQFLVMRRVGDRFQIVSTTPGDEPETLLISRTGHLLDYNGSSKLFGTSERLSSDNIASTANEYLRVNGRPGMHVLNQITARFPEFSEAPWTRGVAAATISMSDRSPWGQMIYAGTAEYRSHTVAVFDVVRVTPGLESRGPIVYGFSLVDVATSLPLLAVIESPVGQSRF